VRTAPNFAEEEEMYKACATSVAGFVQQLACAYIRNGYHHYVVGEIPEGKDPEEIDRRLIERYGIDVSKFVRARRKRAGQASIQYVRFERFFVLCGTRGEHEFYRAHKGQVRDIIRTPIAFGGYSIGYHKGVDGLWHVSVRIHPERYRTLKAWFMEVATKRRAADLGREFQALAFEPYAPVRRQLFSILRAVNRARAVAGHEMVPATALRLRRQIVHPFGELPTGKPLREAA
jgi:hypothetical protein